MSFTFTKLFSSITESTVWLEPSDTRIVWIGMMAMADKHGRVFGSIPGLANRCRVPVEAARTAIQAFLSPDPDSRTKEHEGRRIREIDGGWALLNHGKYRAIRDEEERRAYKAAHERKRRARKAEERGQTRGQQGVHEPIHATKKNRGQTRGQNGQTWTGVDSCGHNADADTDLKENPYGVKEKPKPPLVANPASCEPPLASLPETNQSVDPENNPEIHELATLAVLATPYFRAKPAFQATAVKASHRREVYPAARWEMENNPNGNPSLADAVKNLRKLFERHERGSPEEFRQYGAKPLKFYFADKPYHNTPKKPLALVKPTKFLDEIRREELAGKVAQ